MTEIVECSLKDMRNFFYTGETIYVDALSQ